MIKWLVIIAIVLWFFGSSDSYGCDAVCREQRLQQRLDRLQDQRDQNLRDLNARQQSLMWGHRSLTDQVTREMPGTTFQHRQPRDIRRDRDRRNYD